MVYISCFGPFVGAQPLLRPNSLRAIALISIGCLTPASLYAQTVDAYGSIRMQVNAVSVDNGADDDNSFIGLSDAYSRIGLKTEGAISGTAIRSKIELGLNTADFDVGDPSFFDDQDLRIYSLTASGDWGSMTVGKDWLPYYNHVGYPVDYFSSVYAGYTTYTYFRELQLSYSTPNINGFTGTLARIERTGDDLGSGPQGWQYVGSYSQGGLTLAAGGENMDGGLEDFYGAAISYARGPIYVAAKFEDGSDTGQIYNLYAQYSADKLTYKVGTGLGDQYSGDTFHAGLDYQWRHNIKLFAEAYNEETNYALLKEKAQSSNDYFGAGGFGTQQNGTALVLGVRWDFSHNLTQ